MSSSRTSTPRKRFKADSFATSLSQLVDSLQSFSRFLASETSVDPSIGLQQLGEIAQKRKALGYSIRKASKESTSQLEQQEGWKDELDRLGTELWNPSTALRDAQHSEESSGMPNELKRLVAQMRFNAFKIISLGAVEPLTEKDHASLLSLSTKTVAALNLAQDPETADLVLGEGAEHVAAIELSPSTSATLLRTILAHYTTRMSSSVANGKDGVAEWIKSKLKQELLPLLGEREIVKLAESAFAAATQLVRARSTGVSDEGGWAKATPWLVWSLELLEGTKGEASKAMQVNVLAALAQAHLDAAPPRAGSQKAEEVINQLLILRPSAEVARRRLKLVIAREGGDGEVIKAFVEAASVTPWTESDGTKLLHEVHKLPAARNALVSEILSALTAVAISRINRRAEVPATFDGSATASSSAFLAQLVSLGVLTIKNKQSVCSFITRVSQDAPNFQLDSNSAFLCTTYIWRAADKSHEQGELDVAAQLYLLCTEPMMTAIRPTWAKSFRKAALCLSELKKFEEADENLRRALALDDIAKSHFVRFYLFAMNQRVEDASACLRSMVVAKGFSVQLLLWSAKAAQGAALRPLLQEVVERLLEYFFKHRDDETAVDLLAVLRCLLRLLMEQIEATPDRIAELLPLLERHFSTALEIATSLSDGADSTDTLAKNVSWLQKTGFNICARLRLSSDEDLTSLTSSVVGLMELESKLLETPDPDTRKRMWLYQIASLTEDVAAVHAMEAGPDQMKAHEAVLERLKRIRQDVEGIKPVKSSEGTEHQIMVATTALEMDARAAVGDWSGATEALKRSINSATSTEKSTKLIAQRAAEDPDCPREVLTQILTMTLKSLFSSRSLNPPAVAAWIRLMVGLLLDDKSAEAFSYLESAANFISDLGQRYPTEEQAWVTITAWDKGIDYFTAQQPAEGRRWCELAIRLAKTAKSPILPKMQVDFEALCERCGPSEEESSTMSESL